MRGFLFRVTEKAANLLIRMSYTGFVYTSFIDTEQKLTAGIKIFSFNCNYASKLALGVLTVLVISGL